MDKIIWKEEKLGDYLTLLTDYHANGSYQKLKNNVTLLNVSSYAIMIRTTNFEKNDFEDFIYITEEAYNFLNKSKVYPGDILMNKIANAGSVYVMPNLKRPVSLAMNLFLIRTDNNKLNQRFAYYYLKANESYIKQFAVGTATTTITKESVRNLKIKIPPPATQQKIASILSSYDDLIENNNKRIKILEQTANSIYKDWFIDFNFSENEKTKFTESKLGKIPEGWLIGKIKNITEIKSGFSFKSSDFKNVGKYGLVTIKNVQDGIFQQNCQSFYDILPKNLPSHCLLSEGDILLSLTGNVGRVCVVIGNNYLLNQRVSLLKPIKPEQREFVYFLFRQTSMLKKLESISKGVAQQNLSPIETSELEIVIPPSHLLTLFSKTAKPLLDSVINLNKKNKVLYLTRNTLLPKLISGELDVEGLDIKIRPEIL